MDVVNSTSYEAESLYLHSVSVAVLLMTTALLFYHMTKSSSLEMNPIASKVFAVTLMLISCFYTMVGSWSYYDRISRSSQTLLHHEKEVWYMYITLTTVLILVELCICFFVIQGVITPKIKTLK